MWILELNLDLDLDLPFSYMTSIVGPFPFWKKCGVLNWFWNWFWLELHWIEKEKRFLVNVVLVWWGFFLVILFIYGWTFLVMYSISKVILMLVKRIECKSKIHTYALLDLLTWKVDIWNGSYNCSVRSGHLSCSVLDAVCFFPCLFVSIHKPFASLFPRLFSFSLSLSRSPLLYTSVAHILITEELWCTPSAYSFVRQNATHIYG